MRKIVKVVEQNVILIGNFSVYGHVIQVATLDINFIKGIEEELYF